VERSKLIGINGLFAAFGGNNSIKPKNWCGQEKCNRICDRTHLNKSILDASIGRNKLLKNDTGSANGNSQCEALPRYKGG